MITINGYELPPHISYSALSTFNDCGHKYYLTRMVGVPEHPAWFLIGGNAIHRATEIYDLSLMDSEKNSTQNLTSGELFAQTWAEEMAKTRDLFPDVPLSDYKSAGRASKAYPNKEDYGWWQDNGPAMVERWMNWRKGLNFQIWQPEGFSQPAIELPIDVVEQSSAGDYVLRMYIDRVFVNTSGELFVLDVKTGSRTPTSDLQLAIYAAGIERMFGVRPSMGTYWMARDGGTSPMIDLDYLPTEKILSLVSSFDTSRKHGIFLPNLTNCHYCSVSQYCDWSKK
jgi:hypothetical protein